MTLFDPRPISDADTFGLDLPDIATQSTATPLEALEADYNRDRMSFQSLSAETSNRNYWTPILDRIDPLNSSPHNTTNPPRKRGVFLSVNR